MVMRLREAGCDPLYLEAHGLPHTMCEMTVDGKMVEPIVLLFEPDILRFFQRTLG